MDAKARTIDLIQRTIIITLYVIMTSVITISSRLILGSFISGILEVFLYSFLNSYYVFEYKTAANDIPT
jgi:hypothetical protein